MEQAGRYLACVILALAGSFCDASPRDFFPHLCSGFFFGPTLESQCGYFCYTYEGSFRGTLPDGARCPLRTFPPHSGRCIRGVCIAVSRPKPRECDGVYQGSGYAPTCNYACTGPYGRPILRPYRDGTPCLNINSRGNPVGAAGVCKAGQCIEHDDLEVRSPWVREMVFGSKYHRCLAKKQLTKNYLWDCHHYCKRNSEWYYGVYEDSSRCQHPDQRIPGWCCHGRCLSSDCQRKE
ncbi:uncharacterized protein LOC142564942 isoform X1 [Dermacentor variabilis]|uniref:uncharacterized protein LOC142564942 isoform X1 n=1 Tax=Dermacentor variabilis TaxID=34621 RepID=UPI003F5AE8DA